MTRRVGWILCALLAACGSVTESDDGADDGAQDDGDDGDDGDAANQPPTAVDLSAAAVEEQAPPGTVIGELTAVDPDAGDSHTFELIDDPSELFEIEDGKLVVARGAIPNYEVAATATVMISATDGEGASVEGAFEIEIEDLREVINTLDSGDGSLRQAILDAVPGETILFETGLASSISVNSALQLTKAVTIRGPLPPAEIVLDALGNNLVFSVSPAANVTLQLLTIRGGATSGAGAIENNGRVVIEHSIMEENTSLDFGRGGAIGNRGVLIARDTLFRANSAYNGGAIAADSAGGTLIERCTFVGNQTSGNSGGAIVGTVVTIVNSTFTGNLTTGKNRVGGAIALFSDEPTANAIFFSTIVDNQATGEGGGIFLAAGVSLVMRGTIVTGNTATAAGPDLQILGTITGDHNLIGSASGAGLVNGVEGNIVGTPITLEALADNGGPTPTRLAAAGSPSINLVPANRCLGTAGADLTEDQRGAVRPAGDGCDAGAVEQE